MSEKIGSEPERGREFWPNDNPQELGTVDWKTRLQELKSEKDWDPKKQFWGLPRLGQRYHPLEPFFKFEGTPEHMQTFDKIWWPFIGSGAGVLSSTFAFMLSQRPIYAALPIHVGMGVFGAGIGLMAFKMSRRRARERDAVLIHYAILHEKELPIIERKRFGQIVLPWFPMRGGSDGIHVED